MCEHCEELKQTHKAFRDYIDYARDMQFGAAKHIERSLVLPRFRNQSNVDSPWTSSFMYSSSFTIGATGTFQPAASIPKPRELNVGRLPTDAMNAHVCIRDLAMIIVPTGSVATPPILAGFLEYVDVQSNPHVLSAFGGVDANALSFTSYGLALIAEAPITDANPPNLGTFQLEVISLTLGTATNLVLTFRANIDIQYEAR